MRPPNICLPLVFILNFIYLSTSFNKKNIEECAKVLGENLSEKFNRATRAKQIPGYYDGFVEVEQYDPRAELKLSKQLIEKYLTRRAKFAYDAKISLEARDMSNATEDEVNDPNSKHFKRFMSAKQGNDATTIYTHDHTLRKTRVNETRKFDIHDNVNFYGLKTSSLASAVHIPTPLYDRDPELLKKIDWSDIDQQYRSNREGTRDLAFQLFCSEAGFMRFFPASSWYWDNVDEYLDLFDCRNTEWYINGATCSKNVLIMLDMSGSMLGQRYEIAKQTTEAVMETLSHNDFFNIMPFSKDAKFLDEECSDKHPMLQATMRNKKLLRSMMNNITSEGKAEYEKALEKAFATLKGLPRDIEWLTRDEVATSGRNFSLEGKVMITFPDHVLIVTQDYLDALENRTSMDKEYGCESVIMLITDGAPLDYHEFFEKYNKDKKIRMFTFLIGEEAIDFEQVRNMACQNRGYMVHVSNMADVEEKIQHYIRVMSRPLGMHADLIDEKSEIWSGVYRERLYLPRPEAYSEPVPITNTTFAVLNLMAARRKIRVQRSEARSRMFVTTVSYPVIVNNTFMGVSAVNIPLTELSQIAHPTHIGGRSYFFLLDYNGFIMFHPQLRPIDLQTKLHKQNYNNMELLEMEVAQNPEMRNLVLNCDNSDPPSLDILFSSDMVDRVYTQTNTYYSECIKGSDFILGLAVADNDDYRIKRHAREYDYSKIQLSWADGDSWKVHPYWRYCLLNDTDNRISKEEGFIVYLKQMKKTGKLPELCKPRQSLVDRLLLDLEATSPLPQEWDAQWQFMAENLIHLTFFTSPSGLIRYYNFTLDDFLYSDVTYNMWNIIQLSEGKNWRNEEFKSQEYYQHFVADLHRKAVEDRYFRRSTRMKDLIVFEINNATKLWYPNGTTYSAYGNLENVTLLGQATRAIYKDQALLGVAGMEFVYDWLVNILKDHGCPPSDWEHWCVLLDEHGYVVYSNELTTSYKNAYMDLRGGESHLGIFFAHINRVAERAMHLLVEKGFYKKYIYYDHQATCLKPKSVVQSSTTLRPFRSVFGWVIRFLNRLLLSAKELSLFPFFHSFIDRAEAYTASFHAGHEGFPCTKQSPFYLANSWKQPKSTNLIDSGMLERPCISSKCAVKMQAHFLPNTNLLMVWITQDKQSANCYDPNQCPMREPGDVPFIWKRTIYNSTEGKCRHVRSDKSNKKKTCFKNDFDETGLPCAGVLGLAPLFFTLTTVIVRLFL